MNTTPDMCAFRKVHASGPRNSINQGASRGIAYLISSTSSYHTMVPLSGVRSA
jgi:hypothetical protein